MDLDASYSNTSGVTIPKPQSIMFCGFFIFPGIDSASRLM